jgi:peptidylprolyl isomerase
MKFHLLVGVFALLVIIGLVAYVALGPASKPVATVDVSYPGDPVTGEPVKTSSGLMYYELKAGDGPTPSGPTATVKVHYTGWLKNGTKFDSSVDKGEPFVTELNHVIAGWTEGVASMKVGGKRKLIIPPSLGYANRRQGMIPPGSTLVFDIELLGLE